jgi:hypothetical protein
MADDGWKICHLDNIEPIGQYLGIELCARRQVQPLNIVFSVFILAIVRQVLFKQMQFSNDRAASGAVDGGVLGSDADPNFFTGLKLRGCDDENRAHGGRPSFQFGGFHNVVITRRFDLEEGR